MKTLMKEQIAENQSEHKNVFTYLFLRSEFPNNIMDIAHEGDLLTIFIFKRVFGDAISQQTLWFLHPFSHISHSIL